MLSFSQQAITIIRAIPFGRVTTYGLIATAAGNHCGARQVARLLYSASASHDLPWHRVVNRHGTISPRLSMSHLEQRTLLIGEGVTIRENGCIDFQQFLWMPCLQSIIGDDLCQMIGHRVSEQAQEGRSA